MSSVIIFHLPNEMDARTQECKSYQKLGFIFYGEVEWQKSSFTLDE